MGGGEGEMEDVGFGDRGEVGGEAGVDLGGLEGSGDSVAGDAVAVGDGWGLFEGGHDVWVERRKLPEVDPAGALSGFLEDNISGVFNPCERFGLGGDFDFVFDRQA